MSRVAILLALLFIGWGLSGCSHSASNTEISVDGEPPVEESSAEGEPSLGTEPTAQVETQSPTAYSETGLPPSHPEDGYRHQMEGGVEIMYSTSLKVYQVVGVPHTYYSEGTYYRRQGSNWLIGKDLSGPWSLTLSDSLPKELEKQGRFEEAPTANE